MTEKPKTAPEKATQTRVDTIAFTRDEAAAWPLPDFQRPLTVNEKVRSLSEQIKADGGIIPGIVAFGVIGKKEYMFDGQHRREAFLLSGCAEGYADARWCYFSSMAAMGDEYVRSNSRQVQMRPDDILKGLEGNLPVLEKIRTACPFIGYGKIRRGTTSAILSMSASLRCWAGSKMDTPVSVTWPAVDLARQLDETEASEMIRFFSLCSKAWGGDVEYLGCWNTMNLIMCAWLYRRIVVSQYSLKSVRITPDLFVKCLMSLTAGDCLDWLVGRRIGERDRAPCYSRVRQVFGKRIQEVTGAQPLFPSPPWSSHSTGRRAGVKMIQDK